MTTENLKTKAHREAEILISRPLYDKLSKLADYFGMSVEEVVAKYLTSSVNKECALLGSNKNGENNN